jgi:hypothetical protein
MDLRWVPDLYGDLPWAADMEAGETCSVRSCLPEVTLVTCGDGSWAEPSTFELPGMSPTPSMPYLASN